jgi:hypothetical protein
MGIDVSIELDIWQVTPEDAKYFWDNADRGHLWEGAGIAPYATYRLVPEAFDCNGSHVSAAELRKRLPCALRLLEQRARPIYKGDDEMIDGLRRRFIDFVDFCEEIEKRTGEPVKVIASV